MFSRAVLCSVALLLLSLVARAVEPLTRLAEIRALSPETAGTKVPVRVDVCVTVYDPEVSSFFVSDGTTGIYIATLKALDPAPRPGDWVRIEGYTEPGHFLPQIALQQITTLGSGPPLPPRPITGAELQAPGPDCEWVEIVAVVKATSVDSSGALYFDLLVDGWRMRATVSLTEKFSAPPWDLLERKVRVQCAVGTLYNDQRQMCGRVLTIPGISFIRPVDFEPSDRVVPLRRSTELLLVDSPLREKVRLQGVVTSLRPGSGFSLRDEGGSIRVQTGQPLRFAVGDFVETTGYAEASEFRPLFNAVEASRLQTGPPPVPRPLDPSAIRDSREEQELVAVEARLIDTFSKPGLVTLLCVSPRGFRFNANLPGKLPANIEPGAQLHLTGICTLLRNYPEKRSFTADWFELRLRSEADLVVLARPSWWTAERFAYLAAGIAVLASFAVLWAVVLKQQVRAQAAVIDQQTKLTATLDERQRIARELHDTLEQDLMGVTLLLDNTAEHLRGPGPEAGNSLGIARRLLRRSREESRSTIRDLRSAALEQLGLAAALEETLQPIAAAARIPLGFCQSGVPKKMTALIESSLLRIAHEALANAVKHACPSRIEARLEYRDDHVQLTVVDNGLGFLPAEVDARGGHFGLQGIRERVNKIGGTVDFESAPGAGTCVCVVVASGVPVP